MTEVRCTEGDVWDWRSDLVEDIRQQLLLRPGVVRFHPYRLDRESAARLEKKVI